jgi:uncharacterized protein YodC (DUF2158 family)
MPLGVIKDRVGDVGPFSRGDVVQLRSGGPRMTIEAFQEESIDWYTSNYFAKCVWYDERGVLGHATFNIKLLKKIE